MTVYLDPSINRYVSLECEFIEHTRCREEECDCYCHDVDQTEIMDMREEMKPKEANDGE